MHLGQVVQPVGCRINVSFFGCAKSADYSHWIQVALTLPVPAHVGDRVYHLAENLWRSKSILVRENLEYPLQEDHGILVDLCQPFRLHLQASLYPSIGLFIELQSVELCLDHLVVECLVVALWPECVGCQAALVHHQHLAPHRSIWWCDGLNDGIWAAEGYCEVLSCVHKRRHKLTSQQHDEGHHVTACLPALDHELPTNPR
mmetsp:Transcript_7677/g.13877  ORF Transcript_7677/g.13877 Transcript_7677/m.13877 type:complete len:202 (-) Transcript_7677:345-950(-)